MIPPRDKNATPMGSVNPFATIPWMLFQDTFDMETVSLSFEELMEMLTRNQHLVPTVKARCVACASRWGGTPRTRWDPLHRRRLWLARSVVLWIAQFRQVDRSLQ